MTDQKHNMETGVAAQGVEAIGYGYRDNGLQASLSSRSQEEGREGGDTTSRNDAEDALSRAKGGNGICSVGRMRRGGAAAAAASGGGRGTGSSRSAS